jgi:hypothetical protein
MSYHFRRVGYTGSRCYGVGESTPGAAEAAGRLGRSCACGSTRLPTARTSSTRAFPSRASTCARGRSRATTAPPRFGRDTSAGAAEREGLGSPLPRDGRRSSRADRRGERPGSTSSRLPRRRRTASEPPSSRSAARAIRAHSRPKAMTPATIPAVCPTARLTATAAVPEAVAAAARRPARAQARGRRGESIRATRPGRRRLRSHGRNPAGSGNASRRAKSAPTATAWSTSAPIVTEAYTPTSLGVTPA